MPVLLLRPRQKRPAVAEIRSEGPVRGGVYGARWYGGDLIETTDWIVGASEFRNTESCLEVAFMMGATAACSAPIGSSPIGSSC